MGYKILDVKTEIHEDVEAYFNKREQEHRCWSTLAEIREDASIKTYKKGANRPSMEKEA